MLALATLSLPLGFLAIVATPASAAEGNTLQLTVWDYTANWSQTVTNGGGSVGGAFNYGDSIALQVCDFFSGSSGGNVQLNVAAFGGGWSNSGTASMGSSPACWTTGMQDATADNFGGDYDWQASLSGNSFLAYNQTPWNGDYGINGSPPTIGNGGNTVTFGQDASFCLGTGGGYVNGPGWNYSASGAPPGMWWDGNNCYSGSPSSAGSWSGSITVDETDNHGDNESNTGYWTVNSNSSPPYWTAAPGSGSAIVGQYNGNIGTFSAGSGDASGVGYGASGLPAGLGLSGGTIYGTPSAGTQGTYPVTISASNDGGTIYAGFTLTVIQPPYYTGSTSGSWNVAHAGSIPVSFGGYPAPGNPTLISGSLPSGLSFNGSQITGTPAAGTVGTYTPTFRSTNSGGSANQTVTITVSPSGTSLGVSASAGMVASTSTVTATVTPVPDGGTVDFTDSQGYISGCGAVPVNTSTGQATCTTATLTNTGTDSINATYSGDGSYNGSTAGTSLSIAKATTTYAITSNPSPPSVGQTATYTDTITPAPDGGTVAFSDTAGYISGCSSVPVNPGTGAASCTTSVITATGSDTVTADYSGDSNYDAVNGSLGVTDAQGIANVAVTSAANPTYNQTTTITATLSPVPDGGTVAFSDAKGFISGCGAVALNTITGTASCTTGTLAAAGADEVTAVYSGDANWTSSSGSLNMSVARAVTTTAVTSSPATPSVDTTATITATVSPAPGGGTVAFSDANGLIAGCGAVPVTGQTATCTTATIPTVDSDAIQAVYSSDSNYLGSTGNMTLQPIAANTSVTITASPSPVNALQTSTITATVSPVPDGGTVAFSDGDGYISGCGAVPVDTTTGKAICTTGTITAPGTDAIEADFSGNSDYNGSSGNFTLTINKAPTSVVVAGQNTPTVGSPLTVTATISPVPDGGTVDFFDVQGAITNCTAQPITNGVATCTSNGNLSSPGTDDVTAVYSGDFTYATSGATQIVPVAKIVESVSVSTTPNPPDVGQPFTVTATMTPSSGVGGTVNFSDSAGLVPSSCSSATVTNGVATCTANAPTAVGSDTIVASYSGDTNHDSATNSPGQHFSIDHVPFFTSANSTVGEAGTTLNFGVAASATPSVTSITEAGALPSGVTFGDHGDGTGSLGGTPAAGTGGTYPVGFTASNGVTANGQQSFVLTINASPAFTSADSATFYVGSTSSYITTTDGYPTASITESGALPAGVEYLDNGNGTGLLTGSPAAGTAGSYPVTLTASNGVGAPLVQHVTIVVNSQSSAPTSGSGGNGNGSGGNGNGNGNGSGGNGGNGNGGNGNGSGGNGNGSSAAGGGNSAGAASAKVITYRFKGTLTGGAQQSEACTVSAAQVLQRTSANGSLVGLGVNFPCVAGKDKLTIAGSITAVTKKVKVATKVKGRRVVKTVNRTVWHGGLQVLDTTKHTSYTMTPSSSSMSPGLVISGLARGSLLVRTKKAHVAKAIRLRFTFTPIQV